jgi:gas vesicle protein
MHKLRMFLLGSFLGGLVGGGLAMLLAPMSGKELRGRLGETFGNLGSEMRRAALEREEELRKELSSLED